MNQVRCFAAATSIAVVMLIASGIYGAQISQQLDTPAESTARRLTHPTSEADAKALLERLGCRLAPRTRAEGAHLIAFAALSVVLLALAVWAAPRLTRRNVNVDLGSLILSLTLLLALYQWRAASQREALENEQKATQAYESEVAAMNKAATESATVREMMRALYPQLPVEPTPNYERVQYVYLELDNLEYALERYTQGFASAYTTARAVMTFESRCTTDEFRQRAKQQVIIGSYSPVVRCVVQAILARF
jgi:hypothetical protein